VADERWLALLGWQAAALKCTARDAWIGWSRVLHYQRLHLLANNARFLIFPTAHVPNLASRVLALNLRRLAGDWQQIHGHPLLAETFVDTARFTGACYRAANWQVLGHTRGFSRHNGRYTAHGQPKQVLVYPLHRWARSLLCAPQLPPAWSAPMQRVSLTTAQMEDLHRRLRELPDCRRPRGQRHRLATVLTIAIAAVLAGSRGYTAIAEWAARLSQKQLKRLRARYNRPTGRFEPPSEPTIRRILQRVDVGSVDASLSDWLLGLTDSEEAVAVDGKTLRGAVRDNGTQVHWTRRISPRRAETLDKGHGRLEQRRLFASTALNEYVDFPHVAQVCRIEREITEPKSAKQRSETVFAITSLPPSRPIRTNSCSSIAVNGQSRTAPIMCVTRPSTRIDRASVSAPDQP
jgi:hypothetical protein